MLDWRAAGSLKRGRGPASAGRWFEPSTCRCCCDWFGLSIAGLTTIPRSELELAAWDNFVAESADGWLLHTSAWYEVWGAKDDRSFAVLSAAGQILAVGAIWSERFTRLRVLPLPWISNRRTGIAHASGLSPEELDEIDDFALREVRQIGSRRGAMSVYWEMPSFPPGPDSPALANLTRAGYAVATWPSRVIDLRKEEAALWRDYRKTARGHVRHALRAGLQVTEAAGLDDVETFAAMHRETLLAAGGSPVDAGVFARQWQLLAASGACELLLARQPSGEPVSGVVTLHWKGIAYYSAAASVSAHRELAGNTLLVHEAILRAKGRGDHSFHLGPTPHADQVADKAYQVGRFKDQFGGAEVPWRSATLTLRSRLSKAIDLAARAGSLGTRLKPGTGNTARDR